MMTNDKMESILPSLKKLAESIDSGNVSQYEKDIEETAQKAVDMLSEMIDEEIFKMDPEQAVVAVKVLTKARIDVFESRRKLVETIIKGEAMMKALELQEKEKNGKGNSALLDYLEKNGLNTSLDNNGTAPGSSASIFETIAGNEES